MLGFLAVRFSDYLRGILGFTAARCVLYGPGNPFVVNIVFAVFAKG